MPSPSPDDVDGAAEGSFPLASVLLNSGSGEGRSPAVRIIRPPGGYPLGHSATHVAFENDLALGFRTTHAANGGAKPLFKGGVFDQKVGTQAKVNQMCETSWGTLAKYLRVLPAEAEARVIAAGGVTVEEAIPMFVQTAQFFADNKRKVCPPQQPMPQELSCVQCNTVPRYRVRLGNEHCG